MNKYKKFIDYPELVNAFKKDNIKNFRIFFKENLSKDVVATFNARFF